MSRKQKLYFGKERVLEMHLEKGRPPQRIADKLNITSSRVQNMLGDKKLSREEQKEREKEYLRAKARKIKRESNYEERVQKHIEEAGIKQDDEEEVEVKEEAEKLGYKLTEDQVANVKWLAKNTDIPYRDIAKSYPISKSYISLIKTEKTWEEIDPKKPKSYGKG
jgi:hypothetical protein